MSTVINFYIYGLLDPLTNELRYIGQTKNVLKRYREHIYLSDVNRGNTHKHKWIKKLLANGVKPELLIIDEIFDNENDYWENFYIQYYRQLGCNLVNSKDGGASPKFTFEGRNNIINGLLGKKYIKRKVKFENNDIDINLLSKYYLDEKLSKKDIANKLNISERKVKYLLYENKIVKYNGKSNVKYNNPPIDREYKYNEKDLIELYNNNLTYKQIALIIGCHYETVGKKIREIKNKQVYEHSN